MKPAIGDDDVRGDGGGWMDGWMDGRKERTGRSSRGRERRKTQT